MQQRNRYFPHEKYATPSPRTRSIYLAYRAGCSYDEIAKHTGLTRNTIKRHIRRGLLAIMEHLANTAEPFD